MRIATWNLDRPPVGGARVSALIARIASINADVWVLTETRLALSPGPSFRLASSSKTASDLCPHERWTSIWVRDELETCSIDTCDAERTACARILSGDRKKLLVYGSVLPWRGDPRKSFTAAVHEQEADWRDIMNSEPDADFCLLGDLNQDLLPTGHYYGSKDGRRALRDSLSRAGLTCLTGGANDPLARPGNCLAGIDHICVSGTPVLKAPPQVWPPPGQLDQRLTDHYGVVVTLG